MGLYNEFEVSAQNEKNGVDFTYTDSYGKPVFKVRLARAGGANTKFDQVQEEQMAPYRRTKNMAPSLREKIYRRVFAEACSLPGTWEVMERAGLKCGGNTCSYALDDNGNKTATLKWEPEVPKARRDSGFLKGIEQRDGTVISDTVDNIALMLDALPELFLMLFKEATSRDAFRAEDLEDDAKN